MRVIDGCRCPRLPDEPLPERLICGQCWGQNLQRHQSLKTLIARPEYHRHPACPDLLFQAVSRDP
ncbi:MAG: hypothetical protein ABR926_23285 [Streptosporangiaceae bacterium]